MTIQRTLVTNQLIPLGVSTSGTVSVPATAQAKTITLTVDAANYALGLSFYIEIQVNLGSGWATYAGFGVTDRINGLDGNPIPNWTFTVQTTPLPDCLARGRITVNGVPLLTTITATVS